MSVQAISWALTQRVPPIAKLVLISIGNCADKHGRNAFPGQTHIAEDVGVTDRAVRNWIKWLEERSYLSRYRRERDNGSRSSDGYTLHMDRDDDDDDPCYRNDVPVASPPH